MQEPLHLPSEFGSPYHFNKDLALPLVFGGDSSDYISCRKEAVLSAVYVGFGDVLTILVTVSAGIQQIRDIGHSDDKIGSYRRAYPFLRTSITTKVDLTSLTQAHSPA